jgi:hypothetical protein
MRTLTRAGSLATSSPVDKLPEGVMVGIPEGCQGPLETAYEEKVP